MARRKEFLGMERLVRLVGVGIASTSGWLLAVLFMSLSIGPPSAETRSEFYLPVYFLLPLYIALLATGIGLVRARGWARWPGMAAGALMLLLVPIGTLQGVDALVVLMLPRARRVLSRGHREVIDCTNRVSLGSWYGPFSIGAIITIFVSLMSVVTAYNVFFPLRPL